MSTMPKLLSLTMMLAMFGCSKAMEETCADGELCHVSLLQTGYATKSKELDIQQEKTQSGSKIIVIGDSNGQMACKDLQRFCGGSTVVNMATGGSTAQQYNDGKCHFGDAKQGQKVQDCPPSAPCCNMTRTFDPTVGSGYTHAWVTIGGNDFLDSKPCGSLRGANLEAKITKTINTVRAAGPANMRIVVSGYVTPAPGFEAYGCGSDPNTLKPLNDAIEAAVNSQKALGHNVVFVNPAYATGGSPTSLSPQATHADAIHLNSAGYCTVFSTPEMQAAFGCKGTPCSKASCLTVQEGYRKDDAMCFENVGGCGSIAPPGVKPKPKPKPTDPPKWGCQNNDAAIVKAAASAGITITGCKDVDPSHCTGDHKDTVTRECPRVCKPECKM